VGNKTKCAEPFCARLAENMRTMAQEKGRDALWERKKNVIFITLHTYLRGKWVENTGLEEKSKKDNEKLVLHSTFTESHYMPQSAIWNKHTHTNQLQPLPSRNLAPRGQDQVGEPELFTVK
jgi:hypothetical protein